MTLAATMDVAATRPDAHNAPGVMMLLPAMPEAARRELAAKLLIADPSTNYTVRTPDPLGADEIAAGIFETYEASTATGSSWLLTTSDYAEAAALAAREDSSVIVMLGPDCASLSADGLAALLGAARTSDVDITVPRYQLGAHAGLVNAAVLYPLTCALYGRQVRFPFPLDLVMSARAARHFASGRRAGATGGNLIWPVAEAAAERFTVAEVPVGARHFPGPPSDDLQSALAEVIGSMFADAERKAPIWQRTRPEAAGGSGETARVAQTLLDTDVTGLVDGYRNAYSNLHELWSLVLPPQSLLQLKRLANTPAEAFELHDALWTRIVYDFLLAYRLRTLNTGHLLGTFTPLYLAWVASHLRRADGDAVAAEANIASLAATFVADKPYLLARWRWPDRFNP